MVLHRESRMPGFACQKGHSGHSVEDRNPTLLDVQSSSPARLLGDHFFSILVLKHFERQTPEVY